jgi:hypothetical protein
MSRITRPLRVGITALITTHEHLLSRMIGAIKIKKMDGRGRDQGTRQIFTQKTLDPIVQASRRDSGLKICGPLLP